jgi:hypothetical protein
MMWKYSGKQKKYNTQHAWVRFDQLHLEVNVMEEEYTL